MTLMNLSVVFNEMNPGLIFSMSWSKCCRSYILGRGEVHLQLLHYTIYLQHTSPFQSHILSQESPMGPAVDCIYIPLWFLCSQFCFLTDFLFPLPSNHSVFQRVSIHLYLASSTTGVSLKGSQLHKSSCLCDGHFVHLFTNVTSQQPTPALKLLSWHPAHISIYCSKRCMPFLVPFKVGCDMTILQIHSLEQVLRVCFWLVSIICYLGQHPQLVMVIAPFFACSVAVFVQSPRQTCQDYDDQLTCTSIRKLAVVHPWEMFQPIWFEPTRWTSGGSGFGSVVRRRYLSSYS